MKMKVTILELEVCFILNFEAETVEEAVKLASLAMNSTAKIDWSETTFDKTIKNRTRIKKRKNIKSTINKDS